MGLFDTIILPEPLPCPQCGSAITELQTKAFDNVLERFRLGDCIAHAEELRIVPETLYCNDCRQWMTDPVYLVIVRGILAGVTLERAQAEARLHHFSFETLLLWYHDLFGRLQTGREDASQMERFLREVQDWYGPDSAEESPERELLASWRFFASRAMLEASADPLQAITRYLAERKASPVGGQLEDE